MQANKNPIKINNNYFDKFDYSKELNSNNQYFSTGLYNRPFLKLPGIELVNDVKAGDMSALKKYLAIRMAHYFYYDDSDGRHYYDDLLLLPLLQEDVRMKIIHNALDEGELLHTVDMLQTLTHNYNLDKFKEELEPKFLKRLADIKVSGFYGKEKTEQWNDVVSSVFPGNDKFRIPTADDLLSASRDGDIDAFNLFLKKYPYYDYSYDNLIDSIHNDVREDLIILVVSQDSIDLRMLDVLTLDYDIKEIKDYLYSCLSYYSLELKQFEIDERWDELVIRLFGDISNELVSWSDWNFEDVVAITDPYPKEDLQLSARGYLDKFIKGYSDDFNREVISDKFIGAYEYKNIKVWLYGCEFLKSKKDTASVTTGHYYIISPKTYVIPPKIFKSPYPFTLWALYKILNEDEIEYKKIIIRHIKYDFGRFKRFEESESFNIFENLEGIKNFEFL